MSWPWKDKWFVDILALVLVITTSLSSTAAPDSSIQRTESKKGIAPLSSQEYTMLSLDANASIMNNGVSSWPTGLCNCIVAFEERDPGVANCLLLFFDSVVSTAASGDKNWLNISRVPFSVLAIKTDLSFSPAKDTSNTGDDATNTD